jgi:hypothetical protein
MQMDGHNFSIIHSSHALKAKNTFVVNNWTTNMMYVEIMFCICDKAAPVPNHHAMKVYSWTGNKVPHTLNLSNMWR